MEKIVPITEDYAREYLSWEYEEPYKVYTIPAEHRDEELKEIQANIQNWFAVLDEQNNMIGFYEYRFPEGSMEIGLGLAPQYTGQGKGRSFVRQCLRFAKQQYPDYHGEIFLRVMDFNMRAIRVYERVGFQEFLWQKAVCFGEPITFVCMRKNSDD